MKNWLRAYPGVGARRTIGKILLASPALALLGVAGCSTNQSAGLRCPQVSTIADASALTLYRDGPGRDGARDLTDVRYRIKLGAITGECASPKDRSQVTVTMNLPVMVTRGPAAGTDPAVTVGYFVAVTGPDQTVLTREAFSLSIAPPANQLSSGLVETLETEIPLPAGRDSGAYQVLVGLQLTPDQLGDNRAAAAR